MPKRAAAAEPRPPQRKKDKKSAATPAAAPTPEAQRHAYASWLRAHGVPWDASTCVAAVEYADMSVLHWARNEGCPWDERVCAAAAQHGRLGMLQWLRSQGCPWCMETVTQACRNGRPEILTWAVHNGCPWIPWDARHAVGVFNTAATIAAVRALLDAHHVARDTAVCPKSLYAESMSPMAVRVSARAARVSAIGVTLASQSL